MIIGGGQQIRTDEKLIPAASEKHSYCPQKIKALSHPHLSSNKYFQVIGYGGLFRRVMALKYLCMMNKQVYPDKETAVQPCNLRVI
jgi:hypothetical protein